MRARMDISVDGRPFAGVEVDNLQVIGLVWQVQRPAGQGASYWWAAVVTPEYGGGMTQAGSVFSTREEAQAWVDGKGERR